jgi:hypothetical protein
MSIPFQISGDRITDGGESFAADELHESLWLVSIELRNGLPKRERIIAQRQIVRYEALLDALRKAGAGA